MRGEVVTHIKSIVLFVLSVSFFLSAIGTSHAQGPEIMVSEEEYDFGEVKQGDVLEHTFKVFNIGTETLVIQKVTSS